MKRDLDVPYGQADGMALTLDVYWPATGGGYPAVQMVHGGGWQAGTSDTLCDEAIYFARNGFVAFTINYRLSSPGNPSWDKSFPDTETAAQWIIANAATYGADPTRFATFGTSAGGNLSALLDTRGAEIDLHPKTTVTWSGPMDLTTPGYRLAAPQQKGVERQYLGCTPPHNDCHDDQDMVTSPLSNVSSDDTSLLNFNSTDEIIPLATAQWMDDALASAGVPHKLVVIPGTLHASFYECTYVTLGGVNAEVIDQTVRWLGLKLNGQVTVPTGDYPASACKTH